jgi:hypothetical protein
MQPDLFSSEPRRAKQKRHVPLSSRLTYQAEQGRIGKRADAVRTHLMGYVEGFDDLPTSAEMAVAMFYPSKCGTDERLFVRRGLSDLKAAGIAEHAGTRPCLVSGKQATTWRLKTR